MTTPGTSRHEQARAGHLDARPTHQRRGDEAGTWGRSTVWLRRMARRTGVPGARATN